MMHKPYCEICSDTGNKKSHHYIHYCRKAKGSIHMEHCDACQYLEVSQGDMHCNYPKEKEKGLRKEP